MARSRTRLLLSNRLVIAALLGMLVWFADQPTVRGYNPLLEMFWDPGVWNIPNWDRAVLVFSWALTTVFGHFVLFTIQRMRLTSSVNNTNSRRYE